MLGDGRVRIERGMNVGVQGFEVHDCSCSEYRSVEYGCSEYWSIEYGCSEYQSVNYGCSEYQSVEYGCSEYWSIEYGCSEYRSVEYGCSEGGCKLLVSEHWSKIMRVNSCITPFPLFRVDVPSSS